MVEKIIKFIDLSCIVEEKTKGLFGGTLKCSSENIPSFFELKVCSKIYEEIHPQQNYILFNVPVFQKYDLNGNAIGKPYPKPSNIDF